MQHTQNSLCKNEKYFKKSEWTYNNYSLVGKIVRKRICFISHFQCPKPSKSHTLIVWNVTVTYGHFHFGQFPLWTFTPSHYSSTCRQVTTVFNDWTGNAFNIPAVSVWIKVAATFILLDVNFYKVEILQHSKENVYCVQSLIHNVK